MGKKGLSLEEKRQRILGVYYEKKEVFNLKEIEKIGAKRGVVFQAIKDVNQSLVDDNLVQFDKIGAGAFFWAFPSEGFQTRKNLIGNMDKHISENEEAIAKIKEQIQAEREKRAAAPEEGPSRQDLQEESKELTVKKKEITEGLRIYETCDPVKLERIRKKVKTCKEAANRWTDNLFEIESWIKKQQPGVSQGELAQQFPILNELDYPE